MKLSNKAYDRLKWWAMIGIPACAFLIGQIGEIWELDYMVKVVLLLNAFGTFLGMLLKKSTDDYWAEQEVFYEVEEEKEGED